MASIKRRELPSGTVRWLYGHLFGDRLDVVADAMESARIYAMTRELSVVRDLVLDGRTPKRQMA